MYKSFYNLRLNPFDITPDPSFLFPTPRHNEAMAALYYGVRAHKGFVVLTGEVGTGKTLVVRSALQLLQRSNVAFACVFNPSLTPLEFIRYIAGDFGIPIAGKPKDEVILALNATVDGQSTAHYITDLLHDANVKVTRLAHGVPVGGELDYLDEGTLAAAIRSRTPF